MHAHKPAAALTSGLLARKGAAHPAMRRQTVTGLTAPSAPVDEDLGWNDMGEDVEAPSPVARHIAAINEKLAERAATPPAAPAAHTPAAEPATDRKAAFTLRLDAGRHLRLRLLSAVAGRSAQALLVEALDTLLAAHPNIDTLAADPRTRMGATSGQD